LDGEEALEVAVQRLDDGTFEWVARSIAEGWASQDPKAAFAWYKSIETGQAPQTIGDDIQKMILTEVMRQWLVVDPEGASSVFESLPFDSQKSAKWAFTRYAEDPQHRAAVAQTIAQIGDETLRVNVVEDFGERWARSEPKEAAAWFDSIKFENPVAAFRAAAEISEGWFERDPEGAADWLWPKVPDEAWKKEFIEDLVGKAWAQRDPQAATGWLEKMGYDPAEITETTNQ
jgi:hypothetical protein